LRYQTEWLNQHERIVYDCSSGLCFYSIDVFCEGRYAEEPANFSEKVELYDDWYIAFLREQLKPGYTTEAEFLINRKERVWQLINLKVWGAQQLGLEEIAELRKRLCERGLRATNP